MPEQVLFVARIFFFFFFWQPNSFLARMLLWDNGYDDLNDII